MGQRLVNIEAGHYLNKKLKMGVDGWMEGEQEEAAEC